MSDIRKIAEFTGSQIAAKGIEKFAFHVTESEKREFNIANGEFSLLRTVIGNSISVTAFDGARKGSAGGNDVSEEGVIGVIETALASARGSEEDPAHDIAEKQESEVFHRGAEEPDMAVFFERYRELLEDVAAEYPKINLMEGIASYTKSHMVYCNSNGTDFDSYSGHYDLMIGFSAVDGENTTSMDGCGLTITDPDQRYIDLGNIREKLQDATDRLNLIDFAEKFEGTVIFTPECFATFLAFTAQNYASGEGILDGSSLWIDKVGQQVASPMLTVALDPYDSRIAVGERVTDDGYKSEPVVFLENGVLKQFLIGLYIANKTGLPVTKNSSSSLIVAAGDQALSDIIAGVDRGLLVGGFSGGHPGRNGEFSGVAKNSSYIENGRIVGPVTETMINGNLGDMLMNIRAISREQLVDGSMVIPYVAADGIVISGKN